MLSNSNMDEKEQEQVTRAWPWLNCVVTQDPTEDEVNAASNFLMAISEFRSALQHLDNGVDSMERITSFGIRKLVMREVFCNLYEALEVLVVAADEFGSAYELFKDDSDG